MNPIKPIHRKRVTSTKRKEESGNNIPSVEESVLVFLSLGLTNGAESLKRNYKPSTKVNEFVEVSKEILGALKRGYEKKFPHDSVIMCMRVNGKLRQIELTQLGRDVMLTLDNGENIISNITLTQLYANIRNDMIKHVEIYGKDRQLTAASSPNPN